MTVRYASLSPDLNGDPKNKYRQIKIHHQSRPMKCNVWEFPNIFPFRMMQ